MIRARPSLWFIIAPLATALFLSVAAVALVEGSLQRRRLDSVVALVLSPAVVAAISAPGYLFAVFSFERWRIDRKPIAVWVWGSLVLAVAAAAGAIVASIPTGLGPLLSTWSLVMAIRLLLLYRSERRAAAVR